MPTTDFWNGTGNWTVDDTDWSDGAPPISTENAEIQNGTDSLAATETIASLQIDAPAVLQLTTGGILTDTGFGTVAGYFYLQNGASVSATGGLSITGGGRVDLDAGFIGGGSGSTLTIGGTLTNSSSDGQALDIGNTGIGAGDTVTAIALNNTGAISIQGSGSVQSTLDITGGTAGFGTTGVETGSVYLQNDALLEFASGQIGTIDGVLALNGAGARVADAGTLASNSALTGLGTVTGYLYLQDGASVSTTGDLSITGAGRVDLDAGFIGGGSGSSLTIGGTLTNSSTDGQALDIGNTGIGAGDTVTAIALNNSGQISIVGSGSVQSALDITGGTAGFGTAGVETGSVYLQNDALLEFASGQIGTIDGVVQLVGPDARIADAGTLASNSVLTGLGTVAGYLYLQDGASVSTTDDLSITGAGRVDLDAGFIGGGSGSTLTIGGTLTNSSTDGQALDIGNIGAGDTVTAAALSNSGAVSIVGSGSVQSTLDITGGTAGFGTAGVETGSVYLQNDALLEFASGQIGTIDGVLQFVGPDARVADAGTLASNSALTGLGTVAGYLYLQDGASVSTTGDLSITGAGRVDLDAGFIGGGSGSSLTVGGTLTNSSTDGQALDIGNTGIGAGDTVTATALSNTGQISIVGSGSVQSALDITGGTAGFGTTGVETGSVYLQNDALLEFASGQIGTIDGVVQLVGPDARIADAGTLASNSALTGLGTVTGYLYLQDGASVSTTGDLSITGAGRVDLDAGFIGGGSGSTLTIGGTLTNSSTDGQALDIGNTGIGAGDTVTAAALSNTGAVSIVGSGSVQSTLDITGGTAGFGTAGVETGSVGLQNDALLEFASGQIGTIDGLLALNGPGARIADAGTLATSSALTGLGTVAGDFYLQNGASVSITAGLSITGFGRVDLDAGFIGGGSGSTLTIGGTLTNTSADGQALDIGNTGIGTGDTVTATGLSNTGQISIEGSGTVQSTLDITGGTAGFGTAGVETGSVYLQNDALLEFASGQIGTIDGVLQLNGAGAQVADAGTLASNSALTGLGTIAGYLYLQNAASVSTTGGLSITGFGRVDLDAGFIGGGGGGSSLTIAGTLTNNSADGQALDIGNTGISAGDTVTATGLSNTGAIDIVGSGSASGVLAINGAATNNGAVDIGSSGEVLIGAGGVYTQAAGSTELQGTLDAPTVDITGGDIDLVGGNLSGSTLSIAGGATLAGYGTVAPAITSTGSIEASGGTLDLAGGLATSAPIAIENAAALDLAGADSSNVAFVGASGILELGDPIGFTGTITGLGIGDTLVLDNTQVTGATPTYDASTNTSTLAVTIAGGGTLDFTLAGDYAGDAFGANQIGGDTQIAAVGAAVGQINTPLPVALGTVRQGAGASIPLSITNNAPSGSAALHVTVGGVSGGATASGTIVALPAGALDTNDITVGIADGLAGVQSGTVTLDFASLLSGGNAAPLPSEAVAVSGTVYREAIAEITPLVLYAHVGEPGVETLDITNIALPDGYSEDLIAALTGATGGLTVASGGPTGDIAVGTSNTTALTLDYSTAQPGIVSGNVTVALTSDGGTGAGSIDGLGTVALPTETLPISIQIDNVATAAIQAPADYGTLSVNGDAATLDLGTVAENTGLWDLNFGLANTATGPADLLSGGFVATAANGFTLGGLSGFSDLGAGQTIAEGVTLDTSVGRVVTQTITLDPTDSNASGYSAPLAAQTITVTGTVEVLPSPTITIAPTITAMTDVPALLGLSIADPNPDTLPVIVTIGDATGTLFVQSVGSAVVSGNGSNALTLTGDATDLNEALATLEYTGGAVGNDTINVGVVDQHHASATQSTTVDIIPVPPTAPTLNAPFATVLIPGQPSGIGGISIDDPAAEASGQQISLTLTSTGFATGDISVTGQGGTVIGNGTTLVTIAGTVDEVNSYLSDGVTEDILEDAYEKAEETAKEVGETYGKAWALFFGLSTGALADGLAGAGTEFVKSQLDETAELTGNPTPPNLGGDLLEVDAGLYSFAANVLNDVAALAAGATELPPPAGEGGGDTHIVTYDGQIYQLDGAGDYLLTGSTASSDSFTVEVRLTPLNGSPSASVITQVAAQVGTDTVTIGDGPSAVVTIDGTPVSLTAGTPDTLSGGQITELSTNTYQITWTTGEILTVTDYGSFLNVKVGLGSNDTPGSLTGLMGPDNGQADDFTLPNGTVASVVTTQDLYNFADSYLLPPNDSLLTGADTPNVFFPTTPLSLADFPAAAITAAAQAVASAGITDPGALAAAELDYLLSGGNLSFVAADQSLFQGVTTTEAAVTPPPLVPLLGVLPDQATVNVNQSGTTAVTFDVELTQATTVATTIDYAVVAPNSTDLGATAFGGTLPSGTITIGAGETSGDFTVDVAEGALASLASAEVAVQISSPDSIPIFASQASATVTTPQPGPPPVPTLTYTTDFGTFLNDGNNNYTLDLGPVQYGQPLPTLQFGIENAATAPADALTGTISVAPVEGFTVSGATLPGPLAAGQSYDGLTATINTIKFGDNSETITFDPVDTNSTGYSATLPPITLTITDTLELPNVTYSQAWGDVHIVTYNGLTYNFQAVGDYTLAASRIPNDTFDIEMDLEPWFTGASVTTIHQVAITLGTDTATFEWNRTGTGSDDPVWIDHSPVAFTIGQTTTLAGGTISEVSPDVFKVDWNTGETMTVTNGGSYINIVDGVPPGDLSGGVAGLQGEAEGAVNDFQLADGQVLPQPLTTSQLYGEYLQSWQAPSTDFDGTAPPYSGPVDALSLTDLPADVVAQAAALVAAAGITNPAIAQAAELDYLATGDLSFITSAAATQQQASTVATSVNVVTASTPPAPAIGVMANATKITEASSGATVVTFTAYLTSDQSTATDVHYTVIAGGTGFFDASSFGGTLPSGDVTIAPETESANFQISLPAGALGSLPSENLQVEVSSGAGNATALPIFSPTAQTEIDNDQPVPGNPAVPELSEQSGGGTLTFDSNTDTYTLNLGTLLQGSTHPTINLALDNVAAPPADSLDGSFTAPLGTGFAVTGAALSAPIAAGADYTGLALTVKTGVLGSNTMSFGFNPTDVNETGYSASLGGQITLKVVDTIATPAQAAIDAPSTIVFPDVHVGTTESRPIAVTNTASAPAAGLDVTPYATGFVTATGTVALLAPGVGNSSNLSVALDTSTDGSLSGVVDLVTQSDTGSGTPAAITPFPAIGVFGNVFGLASGTIAPVTDFVHVNSSGTVALDITNTATADGFSENLLGTLASVTQGVGTIGIASAGPTGEIAAGSSDTSSLLLDFSTAQAGTITGTVTVGLTSDGGTGTGSIDGLGTTALPSQMAPVTITVENYANPVFENVSDIGTFAQNGTAYSLNLGTIDQGSAPFVVDLGVLNDVAGPADTASGTLLASGSSAFTTSGLGSFDLGAGQADIAPMVTLSTDNAGMFSETITLAATGSNTGGYSAGLPGETLTVTGTVAAGPGGIGEPAPAIASVLPTGTIDFGAVHVDGTANESLSISNAATTGAASLDGSVSGVTGDAIANGAFTGLAPSPPASTAISVGINTGTVGAQSGTATLAFVSDAGTLGIADLPSQDITVTGSVYREAAAALLPVSEIVHVGAAGTAFLSVLNSDPTDGYSESLIAALIGTSGSIGIASGGPTGDILAGATNTSALAVSFSTAQAGTISGTGTIELTSDGGIGLDSIDNLGTAALGDETVPVNIMVDNYAVAELTSGGNLTLNGSNAFTLNLGTATEGTSALSADLNVLNDVLGPADWLSGTLSVSGSGQFNNDGFGTFGTINAGGSLDAGSVSLATNQTGVFNETIVLTPMDTNADGFSEVLAAQTVTVTGTIVPTGVAQGDVHMVTFDGLHYDFQADGAFILTRSTVPGDNFQIQIQTAPDAADHAVSYTTEAAAQVGSDVVTFAIDRASTVSIDGTPDTTLSAADPLQIFAGGQLQELSSNSFLLTWATGQTLTITDQGSHLDSSVGLGAANGPGSVQGLLGSDSGPANDFQLPDGSVLARPLSSAELYGTFADAWSVTPADSLLDDAATSGGKDPIVAPVAIGTTDAGTMQFIYAEGTGGQTVLQADAPGQVLSAASWVDVLSDAGGFGATFQGTLAEFAHELIADFSAKDVIDITDLNSATASVSYAGSSGEGVLYLTDGTQSGELYLSGSLGGGSFRVSSDGHGGTVIAFS